MELSRRDALAALAAIGVTGGGAYYVSSGAENPFAADSAEERLLDTSVALADVLYPPEVTEREPFVRTYVGGRIEDDEEHAAGMVDAMDTLDGRARERFDAPFRALGAEDGEAVLQGASMERTEPDPDGSDSQRVRYYLVNELLYGLLRSPKGGALVGIENPPGHAGGLEAYREAPGR